MNLHTFLFQQILSIETQVFKYYPIHSFIRQMFSDHFEEKPLGNNIH